LPDSIQTEDISK